MLTLYYTKGSCADVALMMAKALNIDINVINVDIPAGKLEDGTDYTTINPNGYVPALQCDNGDIITELVAICAYLSEQKPGNTLFPLAGKALVDQLQWFNFLATEIHKNIMPLVYRLFGKDVGETWPAIAQENLNKYFAYVDNTLSNQPYLTGDTMTTADFYLFMTTQWADKVGIDLSALQNIATFKAAMKIQIP